MPDGFVCPNCGGELTELRGPGADGGDVTGRICPDCGLRGEVS